MDLESVIMFLTRLYDNPSIRQFTRLEHEAIGSAIRYLREFLEYKRTLKESHTGSSEPITNSNCSNEASLDLTSLSNNEGKVIPLDERRRTPKI